LFRSVIGVINIVRTRNEKIDIAVAISHVGMVFIGLSCFNFPRSSPSGITG